MRGILLHNNIKLNIKVPVTHPDKCRKEQEAVGIHTKNRAGLKISVIDTFRQYPRSQKVGTPRTGERSSHPFGQAEADKRGIAIYGVSS